MRHNRNDPFAIRRELDVLHGAGMPAERNVHLRQQYARLARENCEAENREGSNLHDMFPFREWSRT
jgi:hypothetical protein